MRFRTGIAVCLALAFVGAVCADTIEVPLKFEIAASRSAAGVPIGAVRVADFDMLAPGAKEAPLALDLATSDTQRRIVRNEDDPSTSGVKGGRECRWNPRSTGAGFYIDQEFSQQGARKDMYVLVEYFDSLPAGTPVLLGYMRDDPNAVGGSKQVEGEKATGSNTWKKFQVHLTDAKFDRRPSRSTANPASDFWITWLAAEKAFYPDGYATPEFFLNPPDGEWKLPVLTGPYPVFTTFKFGDNEMLAAIDRQATASAFYDRMRVDLNGNRDLTDDVPVSGILCAESLMTQVEFRDVETKTRVDGRALPYRFSLQMYHSGGMIIDGKRVEESRNTFNFENLRGTIISRSYYEGAVQIDGQPFSIALVDANANGRFDEVLTSSQGASHGDEQIDFSGDSLIVTPGDKPANEYHAWLGSHAVINGRLYGVSVRNAAEQLLLTPMAEETAALRLPMECTRLQIASEDNKTVVAAWKTGRNIPVPPGKYRMISYGIERAEPNGLVWQLDAGATKNTPFTTAAVAGAPGAENLLKFGEPFSPRVTISERAMQHWKSTSRASGLPRQSKSLLGIIVDALAGADSRSAPGAQIWVSFKVQGVGNEVVSNLLLARKPGSLETKSGVELSSKSRNYPKEPEYKILKKGGELVASGTFEYG